MEETTSPQGDWYEVQRRHESDGWDHTGGSWRSREKFQRPEGSAGEVWGLNSKLRSPAHSTRNKKGTQITSGCEQQWSFCPPGRDGKRCRQPLKRPMHKILFASTYPGLQQREGRVHYRCVRRVLGWWLCGENWRNSCKEPCAESCPILQKPSFSGRALLSEWHQPEGKQ